MLNDVHPPPLEPEYDRNGKCRKSRQAVHRSIPERAAHLHDSADRPHELERKSEHGEGIDLIYAEPEDRGGSFNTLMSTIIVGTVLTLVLVIGLGYWWR